MTDELHSYTKQHDVQSLVGVISRHMKNSDLSMWKKSLYSSLPPPFTCINNVNMKWK